MIQNPGWNIGKTLITQQRQKKRVIDSIALNLKFGSRNYLILQRCKLLEMTVAAFIEL